MAAITAADVNKLRKQTGSGMMDCKKALVEAEGDFEKAIEILRKKGQKVAEKRGDREASEGFALAMTADNGKTGIIMSLNCETDFVAKNQDFADFATGIAKTALANAAANAEDLGSMKVEGAELTIKEQITEQTGKIGEKIEIGDYALIEADEVVGYNHPGNQTASLVGFNVAGENVKNAGRDVAMQIAAMAPVALDADTVSQEVIDKEIEIGKEQAIQEGKPADLAEKIAKGKLNKFFKESTLLNQDFIKDNKKSVSEYLKSVDPGLAPTAFKRVSLS